MRKNLAVFGSDDWTDANPLEEKAVVVVVCDFVWFCEDPAKLYPILECVMPSPMENAFALHAIVLSQTRRICYK
jgi:hypothetical protein